MMVAMVMVTMMMMMVTMVDDDGDNGDDGSDGSNSSSGEDGSGYNNDSSDGADAGGSDGNDLGGSDDSGDGSNSDFSEDEIELEMEKCILRILDAKIKYGWSQEETLSQLRNLYEFTEDNHIPHKTWYMVMMFLRKLGYKDPKHYKVCCGTDHVTLVLEDKCPNCDKVRDKCTDYYVLGLNVDSIANKLNDHLAHWEERDEWFNLDNITVPYKEVWHGSRFRELSFFWDEERESCLPTCCPNCSNIISLDEMVEASDENRLLPDDYVELSCTECSFEFVHIVQTVKGNKLNQAFIFHEDGFNAFNRTSRGIAALHFSNACTRKEMRLHGRNLRVYSFIPSHLLNEGIPHKMDAFLQPLIDEINELFLTGIQVHVPETIEFSNFSVAQGNHTIRALLLLGTADLKAHQEMILYAGGIYEIYIISK